ncbi:MAG TPA: aldehyde ferredoxin oxidoreductase family protein [Termitinemataceae bacterium]|nr:aldehyde ferredoxin oxidoreductase family protein [Termitinemataceae bacterium]HOM23115.1 aldehyde ferredoxin oxidoreductase family protein [Termitinemataceae bacterium]HPP99965.1 aldehyde ferredoxin oxidoreductase family protein [Termitinemataceae bacterium]
METIQKERIIGESRKYLEIDVSTRTFQVFSPSEEDLTDYLGGSGLGLKLIYDRLGERLGSIDPLGPDNILAFMMGSFLGTGAPCSARFAGITKSPLTGIMATSSCGGPFGLACKTAGWDGLLIRGRATVPLVLRINREGVRFEEARELWGLETGETQARVLKSPKEGALVIGPAAEQGVLYANIRSGDRYLGRAGLGTVMASKNIKAIVATGRDYTIDARDRWTFERLNKKAKKMIQQNSFVQGYRDYGTPYNVRFGVQAGYMPVRNFRDRTDPRWEALSGQAMAERYRTSHAVCAYCVVLCGHKGTYPDGKIRHIPEYETIGVWGGNIGNYDPDLIGLWNERMNELGMDTISAGVTVSWAMEAAEKGLRPSELSFGKTDNILKIIEDIAYRRGEGAELALGSRRLAERYGGLDFAIQVKGLELAAYDPRAGWGHGLNYAVANRGGCHLNAYPIGLEAIFGFLPPYSTRAKARWVAYMEDLFSAINATQTCLFSIFGYLLEPPLVKLTPQPILRLAMTYMPRLAQALLDYSGLSGLVGAITGRRLTMKDYFLAGRRSHVLERYMNTLCGISRKDDTLPQRFLTEAQTAHPVLSTVRLEPMLRQYYRIKGYDAEGRPTLRTLKKLGIRPIINSSQAERVILQ